VNIPPRNLYYLLLYAWDCLEEKDLVSVRTEQIDAPNELFARLLSVWVQRMVKRGLYREYVNVSEEIPGIRGRLCFNESVSRNSFRRGRAYCEFDDFSVDVLHNRIIKSTISLLLKSGLDKKYRDELRLVYDRLEGVSEPRLERRMFYEVDIHRNNRIYSLPIQICNLLYENKKISEETDGEIFSQFEGNYPQLFEKFVRNFYRRHLTGCEVKANRLKWQKTTGELDRLMELQTDTSIIARDQVTVIETKYVKRPLVPVQYSGQQKKINPDHFRQLYSYLVNSRHKYSVTPRGILLYARTDKPFDFSFDVHGYDMRVVSLDLGASWKDIEQSLLLMVDTGLVAA
jgi:5-methylcytosine-specific restriction enzyme subunit McrC